MPDVVFIVAGGPSAKKLIYKKDLTAYGHVLAVNDASLYTACHDIVSMDGRWMLNRQGMLRTSKKNLYLSRPHYKKWIPDLKHQHLLTPFVDVKNIGVSDSLDYLYAKDSGMMAMAIACIIAKKTVYLIGMDYSNHGSEAHWYKPYSWVAGGALFNEAKFSKWILEHDLYADAFSQKGIKIYNVSHTSKIQSYERLKDAEFADHLARILEFKQTDA